MVKLYFGIFNKEIIIPHPHPSPPLSSKIVLLLHVFEMIINDN